LFQLILGIVNIPSCYTLLYSKASVIWDFLFALLRFLGYNCLAVVEGFTSLFPQLVNKQSFTPFFVFLL